MRTDPGDMAFECIYPALVGPRIVYFGDVTNVLRFNR